MEQVFEPDLLGQSVLVQQVWEGVLLRLLPWYGVVGDGLGNLRGRGFLLESSEVAVDWLRLL